MISLLLFITVMYQQADTPINQQNKKVNELIHATSPYLLQHAHQPVQWREWNPKTLADAKKRNKPILVSIGYSSCHWCHVMAHESFDNNEVAVLMNKYFINIKVDREERPDIDQIYMDAIHAMGIRGGWPLNVFLTPSQKPFYGGTYFPTADWKHLLVKIGETYQKNQGKIEASANKLTQHIAQSDVYTLRQKQTKEQAKKSLQHIYQNMEQNFDPTWGGMGDAPKFVMPTQWEFLLRNHLLTGHQKSLAMVNKTLTKVCTGGIYDHIGGGFARYSVDNKWFEPHFEKMLYDNAQLLSLYSNAYSIRKNALYKYIVYESISWLNKEMSHNEGGFYSAIDADSEGEEGKFYVWTQKEFNTLLSELPSWLGSYYDIRENGNWKHGQNILHTKKLATEFAKQNQLTIDSLHHTLHKTKEILLQARSKRTRPGTDDKILTGWNAMAICGLIDAWNAFGDENFLERAHENISFLEKYLVSDKVYRIFRKTRSNIEGFLEDYAFLIQAYIALYQATFNEAWIHKADYWTAYVQKHFYDNKEGFYFYTSHSAANLIVRKKELYDNVIPSSNSVMAKNLYHLGIILDKAPYKEQAQQMVDLMHQAMYSNPSYTSHWNSIYTEMTVGINEVVVIGESYKSIAQQIKRTYTPFSLLMGCPSTSELPLLKNKHNVKGETFTIYVCRNKLCLLPVHSVEEALLQIDAYRKLN